MRHTGRRNSFQEFLLFIFYIELFHHVVEPDSFFYKNASANDFDEIQRLTDSVYRHHREWGETAEEKGTCDRGTPEEATVKKKCNHDFSTF